MSGCDMLDISRFSNLCKVHCVRIVWRMIDWKEELESLERDLSVYWNVKENSSALNASALRGEIPGDVEVFNLPERICS